MSCSYCVFSIGCCACHTSLDYLWFSTLCLGHRCFDLVLIYIYIILRYFVSQFTILFHVKFVLNMWLMNPFWRCHSVALQFFLVNFLRVSFNNAVICEDYVAWQMNGVWSIGGMLLTEEDWSTWTHLTFRGPCIMIYSYNKSQQDALFLNFILVKNSACFGQTYCPSSGALILYSQKLVFIILVMLTVC